MTHKGQPKFKLGDRIAIAGLPYKSFEIFAVHLDYYMDADNEYYDGYYDCYCEQDGEYYYAEDEDITLISRPDKVDYDKIKRKSEKAWDGVNADIQKEMDREEVSDNLRNIFIDISDALNEAIDKEEELLRRNRELTKQERIDLLLDELNDVDELIRMFGDHEDDDKQDRRYVLRRAEIYAKLQELTGGGKRA